MAGPFRPTRASRHGQLRSGALTDHSRGHVRILDAEGLRRKSCECLGVISEEYNRLVA